MAVQMRPFAGLTVERRNHLLRLSLANGDRVRQDRRNPDVWLVSSATRPNVWYRVRDGRSCGCKWHQERGTACRHLVRVSWERHQQRKQEQTARRDEMLECPGHWLTGQPVLPPPRMEGRA